MSHALHAVPLDIEAPVIEYGLLMPVFLIFIGACLGVLVEALVPRDLRRTVQLFLTFLSIAAAFVATVINWSGGDSGDRRGGLAGDRRADPLHVGDPAGLRCGVAPAVRRALDRERQPLRCSGLGRTGYAGRAGGDRAQGRAHRGLSAGPVRVVRDDAVPGVERPDHHVRGAGDLVAAALPALRAGPAAPAAVAGVGAEVLPAGRAVVGVLPVRGGVAVRLRRLVHPGRHRRRAPRQQPAAGAAARRHGADRRRVAVQVRRGAVPLLDPGRVRRRSDRGHRLHGRVHQDRRDRRADAGVLRRPRAATAGTGNR